MRYSLACKSALLLEGCSCEPQPGVGSRRFDDGTATQLPAVQAEGPLGQRRTGEAVQEKHRPDETTLLALEDLFCQEDSPHWDLEELLRSYRKAFQKTCLQASRLQATARAWHRALADQLCHDEEVGVQWAAWHALISDRLLEVDWVVWLAPDSALSSPTTSTFRDALLVLPWFTFELVHVPSLTWPGEPVLCLGVEHATATKSLSHETVISSPELLDFAYWAEERSSPGPVLLSCVGLITSLDIPGPVKSFSILEEALRRLRLYSDVLRGSLLLWLRGRPTILFLPDLQCPGQQALTTLAPFSAYSPGVTVVGNCPCEVWFSRFHCNYMQA